MANISDLSQLENVEIQQIIKILIKRFKEDLIYTYINDTLISLNPNKDLSIYDDNYHDLYSKLKWKSEQLPHIFYIANQAYKRLKEEKENQTIIVSGESGSGKTEACKLILKHLTKIIRPAVSNEEEFNLYAQINHMNPVLEAFGNAKTSMNKNSSRFGKLIQLHIEGNRILGCELREFLFEKSRLVRRNEIENNFHIFYYIVYGMNNEDKLLYHIEDFSTYRIIKNEGMNFSLTESEIKNFQLKFNELNKIFKSLFTQLEIETIFSTISAILWLTNIKIYELDGLVQIDEDYPLQKACHLLGIDPLKFGDCLLTEQRHIHDKVINILRDMKKVEDIIDATGKLLYHRLFNWLVKLMNEKMRIEDENVLLKIQDILILDMAGFEDFQTNSLEQLFINIANEELHLFYINNLLIEEQKLYRDEEIEWKFIDFKGNELLVNFFKKKFSKILDEQSRLLNCKDYTFLENLKDSLKTVDKDCKMFFDFPINSKFKFRIEHYAKKLEYDSFGFLNKNRDYVSKDVKDCLLGSTNTFISDIIAIQGGKDGSITREKSKIRPSGRRHINQNFVIGERSLSKRLSTKNSKYKKANQQRSNEEGGNSVFTLTASQQFLNSLQNLLSIIKSTNFFFIKCFKVNTLQEPNNIDEKLIAKQIHYNGLSELATIRAHGYDKRINYEKFYQTYKILSVKESNDSKTFTKNIIEQLMSDKNWNKYKEEYVFGRNKVFLRNAFYEELEKYLLRISITLCQKYIRGYLERKKYLSETKQLPHKPKSIIRQKSEKEENFKRSVKFNERNSLVFNSNEPWDLAQIIPRERTSASESSKRFLWALKVFLYIMFFIFTLGGAVCSHLGLIWMTSNLNINKTSMMENNPDDRQYLITWTQLIFILSAVQFYSLLISVISVIFGRWALPRYPLLVKLMIIEFFYASGLVAFVTQVLPNFGTFYGVVLLNSVCILPSFLQLIYVEEKMYSLFKKIIDFLAFIIQFAAIILPCILKLLGYMDDDDKNHLYWIAPLSLIFCSIRSWENFIDNKVIKTRGILYLHRNSSNIILSFFNIMVTIGVGILLEKYFGKNMLDIDKITDSILDWKNYYFPGTFLIIGASLSYYAGSLAIKLKMQIFSYSLALMLVTPVLITILLLQIEEVIPKYEIIDASVIDDIFQNDDRYKVIVIGALILTCLSTLWIGRHMWKMNTERLIKREKCFVMPLFNPILIGTELILNKRRNVVALPQIIRAGQCENESHNEEYRKPTDEYENEAADYNDSVEAKNQCENESHHEEYKKPTDENDNKDSDEEKNPNIPTVYACATMWHETRNEMMQLMKSIFRMDLDYSSKKIAKDQLDKKVDDFYKFETHIFFDDAFHKSNEGYWEPNDFVKTLKSVVNEGLSSIYQKSKGLDDPIKVVTPYGGRLTFSLPGGTSIIVHLKNKDKIRHRKRWSQVMYMYYLLGYKIFGLNASTAYNFNSDIENNWDSTSKRIIAGAGFAGRSEIFRNMPESKLKEAQNTFILALDGDVDFKPEAVLLLVDRMKKNYKTGAACGRIHPIGNGPMVWYQIFEYAIGHWFQKSTEHVLGCVLCSPGCFSLFRGSALLDDNVMKRYTTIPTEAMHHIQWDQGEDRWLCTLLLQQGYRVDYTAASDALTFAPENFNEFFNQRRRWMPSTLANIMDLLSDYNNVLIVNDNISKFYIAYQFLLMISTILGPSTILLSIAAAFTTIFPKWETWTAYLIAIGPMVFYIAVCLKCKPKTQLAIGALLSTAYTSVMLIVLISIIQSFVRLDEINPSLVFIIMFAGAFIWAGILHPQEFSNLFHGILYFLTIPSGYLILVIYSLSNLHVVTWGTREVPKKLTAEEERIEKLRQEEEAKKPKRKTFLSYFTGANLLTELSNLVNQIFTSRAVTTQTHVFELLSDIHEMLKLLNKQLSPKYKQQEEQSKTVEEPIKSSKSFKKKSVVFMDSKEEESKKKLTDDEIDRLWLADMRYFGGGKIEKLKTEENQFWKLVIHKYLTPIPKNVEHEKKINQDLLQLRNNVAFAYWLANGLWILLNYMLQADTSLRVRLLGKYKLQPIGLVFMVFFAAVLFLQLACMIKHRWGTLLQILSITNLWTTKKVSIKEDIKKTLMEPDKDYNDNDEPLLSRNETKNRSNMEIFANKLQDVGGKKPYLRELSENETNLLKRSSSVIRELKRKKTLRFSTFEKSSHGFIKKAGITNTLMEPFVDYSDTEPSTTNRVSF